MTPDCPTFSIRPIDTLDDILGTYAPPDNGTLNSGDAVASDVKIRDYDASNKAVPDVMAELLRYCGFVMSYYTDTYTDGTPETHLRIVRRDGLAAGTPKLLYLSANGSTSLNLATNNTSGSTPRPRLQCRGESMDDRDRPQAGRDHGLSQHRFSAVGRATVRPFAEAVSLLEPRECHGPQAADVPLVGSADECGDGHWNVVDLELGHK